jgi:hypothetical protein
MPVNSSSVTALPTPAAPPGCGSKTTARSKLPEDEPGVATTPKYCGQVEGVFAET